MIDIWKMKTIEEALDYCKSYIVKYNEGMSKVEKEHLASCILSFSFGDHFQEWYTQHPVVDEIQNLASDLEWSNSSDIDEDWEKLLGYIEQLDREVHASK